MLPRASSPTVPMYFALQPEPCTGDHGRRNLAADRIKLARKRGFPSVGGHARDHQDGVRGVEAYADYVEVCSAPFGHGCVELVCLFDYRQNGAGVYAVILFDFDRSHPAAAGGLQLILHFHGFDHHDSLSFRDLIADRNQHANHLSRHSGGNGHASQRAG